MNEKSLNKVVIGVIAVFAFAVGIWLGTRNDDKSGQIIVQDRVITVLPKAKDLKPFNLATADGKPFTVESLRNKYTFLFFGYTSCPDVCPTTLKVLGTLYSDLAKKNQHRDVQVVFVSVDPRRDKPDVLKKYVAYFHKDFIGVTGNEAQIANLAKQLGASYEVLYDGKSDNYPVNHTGLLFVTNPDARYAAIFSPPHEADLIESRLRLLEKIEQ